MANSFTKILIHVVFSTKYRERNLRKDIRSRLFPYMAGIAKTNGFNIICIGGVEDHVHFLMAIKPTMTVSHSVQLVKCGSSKWIRDTFSNYHDFSWQVGYGGFSVGCYDIDKVKRYIENQEEHHRRVSFREECLDFLRENGIEYDEKYVFG